MRWKNARGSANSIISSNEPVPKPVTIVMAGETTVTVSGNGLGGRNQELVLAAALKLRKVEGTVIASMSTDARMALQRLRER